MRQDRGERRERFQVCILAAGLFHDLPKSQPQGCVFGQCWEPSPPSPTPALPRPRAFAVALDLSGRAKPKSCLIRTHLLRLRALIHDSLDGIEGGDGLLQSPAPEANFYFYILVRVTEANECFKSWYDNLALTCKGLDISQKLPVAFSATVFEYPKRCL